MILSVKEEEGENFASKLAELHHLTCRITTAAVALATRLFLLPL